MSYFAVIGPNGVISEKGKLEKIDFPGDSISDNNELSEALSGSNSDSVTQNTELPKDKSEESFNAQNNINKLKDNVKSSYKDLQIGAKQLAEAQKLGDPEVLERAQARYDEAWNKFQGNRTTLKTSISDKQGSWFTRNNASVVLSDIEKDISEKQYSSLLSPKVKEKYDTQVLLEKAEVNAVKAEKKAEKKENIAAKKRETADLELDNAKKAQTAYEATIRERDTAKRKIKESQNELPLTGSDWEKSTDKLYNKKTGSAYKNYAKADNKSANTDKHASKAETKAEAARSKATAAQDEVAALKAKLNPEKVWEKIEEDPEILAELNKKEIEEESTAKEVKKEENINVTTDKKVETKRTETVAKTERSITAEKPAEIQKSITPDVNELTIQWGDTLSQLVRTHYKINNPQKVLEICNKIKDDPRNGITNINNIIAGKKLYLP